MLHGNTGQPSNFSHQNNGSLYLPCLLLFSRLIVAHLSNDEIETILRENYVELHRAMCVNPAAMAKKLYVQGFITEDTLHAVASNQTATTVEAKADILMMELYSFILAHESPAKVFAVFLGILKSAGGASHNVHVAVSILEVL